jgi:hypothetical protein
MKWIRIETHRRYHAVLGRQNSKYVTWCGRHADPSVPVTDTPPLSMAAKNWAKMAAEWPMSAMCPFPLDGTLCLERPGVF